MLPAILRRASAACNSPGVCCLRASRVCLLPVTRDAVAATHAALGPLCCRARARAAAHAPPGPGAGEERAGGTAQRVPGAGEQRVQPDGRGVPERGERGAAALVTAAAAARGSCDAGGCCFLGAAAPLLQQQPSHYCPVRASWTGTPLSYCLLAFSLQQPPVNAPRQLSVQDRCCCTAARDSRDPGCQAVSL